MSDLRKINIDGDEHEVPGDYTLMQACEEFGGAEIPRFCYHKRLSVAGNCRMCLVEWVGAPKPQASCALQVKDLRPNRDGTPPNGKPSTISVVIVSVLSSHRSWTPVYTFRYMWVSQNSRSFIMRMELSLRMRKPRNGARKVLMNNSMFDRMNEMVVHPIPGGRDYFLYKCIFHI